MSVWFVIAFVTLFMVSNYFSLYAGMRIGRELKDNKIPTLPLADSVKDAVEKKIPKEEEEADRKWYE